MLHKLNRCSSSSNNNRCKLSSSSMLWGMGLGDISSGEEVEEVEGRKLGL